MMPAWLIQIFIKTAVTLVIKILEKSGCINKAEAMAVKFGLTVKETIENVEVDQSFPVNEETHTKNKQNFGKKEETKSDYPSRKK